MAKALSIYINKGFQGRVGAVKYLLSPAWAIQDGAHQFIKPKTEVRGNQTAIGLAELKTEIPEVNQLRSYLTQYLANDLLGVYLHGSVGTEEVIPFSDLDAIVIVKSEVFDDLQRFKRVAQHLHQAQRYLYAFDPLQHHGWFILGEHELAHYPFLYFPIELWAHAKVLMGEPNLVFHGDQAPQSEYIDAFQKAAKHFKNRLALQIPSNLWQLKGILSMFMLFPSLFWQAKNGKGIFKKESFEQVKPEFAPDTWEIMEQVSRIRMDWVSPPMNWRARIYKSPHWLARSLAKTWSFPIPKKLSTQLTPEFYNKMRRLIEQMELRLKEENLSSQMS